ncbi:unnamed protein product [Cercospora beticola]|nr:unnamed protein product [Cercospora beticola]
MWTVALMDRQVAKRWTGHNKQYGADDQTLKFAELQGSRPYPSLQPASLDLSPMECREEQHTLSAVCFSLPLNLPKLVTQRRQSVCLESTFSLPQLQSLPPGSTPPYAIVNVDDSVAKQKHLNS